MTQRTALMLAVGLTAFVLVVGGGVAGRLAQSAPAAVAPTAPPTDLPAPTQDPETLLQQREAEYQALIDEANRRLQESYQKQQALADQLNATPTKVPKPRVYVPPPTSTPTYAVTPEMAITLALGVAPGATVQHPPELVNFQGIVAYEVVTDRGNVYVEANTGQILYNGTTVAAAAAVAAAPQPPPAPPPASGGQEPHEDHEEHGGGGD